MQRTSIALLSVFARRTIQDKGPIAAPTKYVNDEELSAEYTREYYRCGVDAEELPEVIDKSLLKPLDGTQFSVILSRLHKTLRKTLGAFADPYLISDGGKRPRVFRCTLPPNAIRFSSLQEPASYSHANHMKEESD